MLETTGKGDDRSTVTSWFLKSQECSFISYHSTLGHTEARVRPSPRLPGMQNTRLNWAPVRAAFPPKAS
ncbi:hypothetical protein NQZ68_023120 [Dissostichus eleginoides]|nr:hypothetical protein NQZ68_023120 [Dissostichus eleginoides]